MFVTKIKNVLAAALVAGLALGGIGTGIGLSTTPAAVAQQPAQLPGGAGPVGGPEQKAKAKETDWRIGLLDEQIALLRELQKRADNKERSAAIERTIGDLLDQRERFLKKLDGKEAPAKDDKSLDADALKRAELKLAEPAAAAADVEVAKAIAQVEAAKANAELAQAIYQLHKQALEKLRKKSKGGMPPERRKATDVPGVGVPPGGRIHVFSLNR